MSSTRLSIALLLITSILTGCSSLTQDMDPPEVSITGFRPVSGTEGALNFEIDLRILNPNRQKLEIQGIAYTISLEGRKLITGVGKDLPAVEGYGEETVTLTASAGMFEAMRLLGDMVTNPKDKVAYQLDTKIDVGTFAPAIRVEKFGEISLQPSR